jgi:class 3 adenylate cyclase
LLVAGSAAFVIVLATLTGILATRTITFLGAAERWLADLRSGILSPAQPVHPEIVLVTITEDTLATLPYRSPLDRGLLVDTLIWLDEAEVRAVGIDILFDQRTEPDKDDRLKAVLEGLRAPVIVAWADEQDDLTPRQARFLNAYLSGVTVGLIALPIDPHDGIVRRFAADRRSGDRRIAGFAPAIAERLGLLVAEGETTIAFRPPPAADALPFRQFPIHLLPNLPPRWFADKIVLIGFDLPHADRHRTPFVAALGLERGSVPGVAIHGHALAQILDGRTPPGMTRPGEALVVLGSAAVALGIAALPVATALQIAIIVAVAASAWTIAFVLFAGLGSLVPLVSPSIAYAAAAVAGTAYFGSRARSQKRFIRDAFSRLTAPAVVEALLADPSHLRIGGEKRVISCVFTDIAGFTSMMERFDPEPVLAALNDYLDGMCRIVFDHGGTLNRFTGDGMYVMFGAPVDQPDHAQRAIRCAIAMDAFGRSFAAACRDRTLPFGITRIGVHSGPAIVGNFGGERAFDYTAHGDTVNTASRLEGANKAFGTTICASIDVVSACSGLLFRPTATVLLKGKAQPIQVFEPVAPESACSASLTDYIQAYTLMRDRELGAGEAFARLAAACPEDALIRFHAARLAAGQSGVTVEMTGK